MVTRGFSQSTLLPLSSYTRGVGWTISKRTPHSREDRQDFVIPFRTYSKSSDSDRGPEDFVSTDKILGLSILIRSEICYWECSFNEHSQYYALKRTRTSTLFSTRFWVSRVYHFTIKASWKWIVFHEYDIYLMWYMEYMTKVECWSISIDRSCHSHIGPGQTSNCFDLNYPEDALYISKRWTIKPISRFNRSQKRWIGSQIRRDM